MPTRERLGLSASKFLLSRLSLPVLNQIEMSWRGRHASAVSYYHRLVDRVGELLSCELVGGLYHEIEIVGEDVEPGDLG